jgi:uncharacterized protein YcfJ
MRSIMLKTAGVFGALAIALSAGACSGANDSETLALNEDGARVEVASAKASNAEARAQAAEARAAAAEAKIQCEKERQEASNKGAVVGGITGAVVGSQVAGDGAKSEGGAIGAVGGILAGRQIAKKDHRC